MGQTCQSLFCSACNCQKVSVYTNFDVKLHSCAIMDLTVVMWQKYWPANVGVLVAAALTPTGWLERLYRMRWDLMGMV